MPRKRVSPSQRETPEAIAARRARIEELRTPLDALTPKQEAKLDRKAREWVAALPKDDAEALAQITAEAERAAAKASERKPVALVFMRGENAVAPAAERPAPATKAAPVGDEPPEPPKKPRRRPAGLVAVIDPRLYDTDEEDWT